MKVSGTCQSPAYLPSQALHGLRDPTYCPGLSQDSSWSSPAVCSDSSPQKSFTALDKAARCSLLPLSSGRGPCKLIPHISCLPHLPPFLRLPPHPPDLIWSSCLLEGLSACTGLASLTGLRLDCNGLFAGVTLSAPVHRALLESSDCCHFLWFH